MVAVVGDWKEPGSWRENWVGWSGISQLGPLGELVGMYRGKGRCLCPGSPDSPQGGSEQGVRVSRGKGKHCHLSSLFFLAAP